MAQDHHLCTCVWFILLSTAVSYNKYSFFSCSSTSCAQGCDGTGASSPRLHVFSCSTIPPELRQGFHITSALPCHMSRQPPSAFACDCHETYALHLEFVRPCGHSVRLCVIHPCSLRTHIREGISWGNLVSHFLNQHVNMMSLALNTEAPHSRTYMYTHTHCSSAYKKLMLL